LSRKCLVLVDLRRRSDHRCNLRDLAGTT